METDRMQDAQLEREAALSAHIATQGTALEGLRANMGTLTEALAEARAELRQQDGCVSK